MPSVLPSACMQSLLEENANDFSLMGAGMNRVQTQPVHQSACQSQPAQRQRAGGERESARVCAWVCGWVGGLICQRGLLCEWAGPVKNGSLKSSHVRISTDPLSYALLALFQMCTVQTRVQPLFSIKVCLRQGDCSV